MWLGSSRQTSIAPGVTKNAVFNSQLIAINEGDKFIICPLSETGYPFTTAQFQQFLTDDAHLASQVLAQVRRSLIQANLLK